MKSRASVWIGLSVAVRNELSHLPVGRLDEAVLVDLAVGRQRADETDVRPLRRLDRAHPAVVGRVHVANVEARRVAVNL